MSNLAISAFTFAGYGTDVDRALTHATEQVNSFLETHQWRTPEGHSAYRAMTTLHMERDGYIYIVLLIGPAEATGH